MLLLSGALEVDFNLFRFVICFILLFNESDEEEVHSSCHAPYFFGDFPN